MGIISGKHVAFTPVRKLGASPNGETWMIQRGKSPTPHVLKKLPHSEPPSDDLVMKVMRLLGVGEHPNILPVREVEVADNHLAVLTDFAGDGSLEEWLTANGGKSPDIDTAVRLTLGILNGLEFLHGKGVVHGNLTPSNVMLADGQPKLTDFGTAPALAVEGFIEKRLETIRYYSPERLVGEFTPEGDVWSAAVILYRMVSGRLPFPQDDPEVFLWAIKFLPSDPLPRPVPEPLRKVIEEALDPTRPNGAPTTRAMREALIPFLSSADEERPKPTAPTTELSAPTARLVPPTQPMSPVTMPTKPLSEIVSDPPPSTREDIPAPVPFSEPMFLSEHLAQPAGVRKWRGALLVVWGVLLIASGLAILYFWPSSNQSAPPPNAKPKPEVAQPVKSTPPAPKAPEPDKTVPTKTVSSDGKGDFKTISQAAAAVEPGTRILVKMGIYEESVEVLKNVEIVGDGSPDEIVIESRTGSCLETVADSAKFQNLTFRGFAGMRGGKAFSVAVTKGKARFENCVFSSDSLACVAVSGKEVEAVFRKCRIQEGESSGIGVWDDARCVVEDCDITQNALAGIVVSKGGAVVVTNSRVTENRYVGIRVYDNGRASVTGTTLTGNKKGSWDIAPGSLVEQSGNRE